MSRVRLIDIYNERFNESSLKLSATADIEVVPRRMIEMIIAECTRDVCAEHKSDGAKAEASLIKRYAEDLLEEFETDGEV